ncbi:MAG: cobyrinic acid a,c-diamide synthase [Deltaproteobacteria bacterium HGW-Deltaproteobacteria-2]|nr:MAG: cobyrinic acid a,c-diamide synthase [Deltaproteobacteria bacterium HGW-Deltaproteobacteria-2]
MALCGKGGVGKTSVSALMVKNLVQRKDLKVLAIDADPAVGLCTALGIQINKTVDDIRNDLINSIKKGVKMDKTATLNMLDYELFDALTEVNNVGLLAIGRPESEGCFCKVNSLLKDIIQNLAKNFDVVLIDGEAGVEQINRRVMKTVDHLIMISDTSAKGINVANTIKHLAQDNKAVNYKSMGMILNRVRNGSEVQDIRKNAPVNILGWLPEDDLIREFDFPDSAEACQTVDGIINALRL